jgi:hypothetical protein
MRFILLNPLQGVSRIRTLFSTLALAAIAVSSSAQAAVVISSAATENITCASGVCAPSKRSAILNVIQLQTMLASGNVKVTSAGSTASNIVVATGVTWVSGNTLTLDAYQSITVNKTISVAGTGGLAILTNDGGPGGTFSFGAKGDVNFWNLSDALTINGSAYTLVGNIATLARDIASNGNGSYALANSYNAQADGTYSSSPVTTAFRGTLEGLGNTISNLSITTTESGSEVGFFLDCYGTIENLNLTKENISVSTGSTVGGLAVFGGGEYFNDSVEITISGGLGNSFGGLIGESSGSILRSHSTGKISSYSVGAVSRGTNEGGLVGQNGGSIMNSYSTVTLYGGKKADIGGLAGISVSGIISSYASGAITGGGKSTAGGLVGQNTGEITGSYAAGTVTGGSGADVGGIAGVDSGPVTNSYATGNVTGGDEADVGGLIGINKIPTSSFNTISASYSRGAVAGGTGSELGGLLGIDDGPGRVSDCYWETTTSGITSPSQGAGNISNDTGITGLSTSQLQSGLPTGFSSTIWGENSKINGGLPYLLALPPPG